MLFSKEKAELQEKLTKAETELGEVKASLATANTERDAAQAKATELEARLTEAGAAHEAAIADLKEKHNAALAAKDTEVDAKVNQGVIDAMAAIGVPEANLPARAKGPAANDHDAQIEDLNAQIAETKDPLEKGKLASKVLALMEAKAQTSKS